ncbi:hypothetical protein HP459_23155 [Enterobacter sp. CM29]|uniref:hypothetical protein n=1 Tax=Enterobacter sp. CM29 TaxID=2738449 RepID=UPI0015C52998|nr:hypothetical protein [Enterobacter sp. CM29]NQD64270.1 hypothetical protein [Enterobacter sp. CM29]
MPKLFRLASQHDYSFIPELNLWELSFDKRPLKGVRCNDPVDGAFDYNQARLKFFIALDKGIKQSQKFNFDDILVWAATKGTALQCNYVMQLLLSKNIGDYKRVALDFSKSDRVNYPYHLDIAVFFTGFQSRMTTNHELIELVKDKCNNEQQS